MGRIFYIMGKSVSGKDTIYRQLIQDEEFGFRKLVPYTTRPIRSGEKDGEDYFFTDEEGITHYWIIGKNGPELNHYGFAEYLQPPEGGWTAGYVARTNNNEAPWLDKAREELGFHFEAEP